MDLTGKRVIVTGGASGIAASAVRGLAAAGAAVASIDVSAEAGRLVAAQANAAGPGTASFHEASVADRAASLTRNSSTGVMSVSGSPSLPPSGTSRAIIASCTASCSGGMPPRVFSYIAVHMPGATAFTAMPCGPHSCASVRVQASTAPLDAA